MTPVERQQLRRTDFRFLLDDPRFGSVVVIGADRDPMLRAGLEQLGARVGQPGAPTADLVIAIDPAPGELQVALGSRRPGGVLYVETTSRARAFRVTRRCSAAGLQHRTYGCWPTCASPTRFLPLWSRSTAVSAARDAKNRRRRAIGVALARLGLARTMFPEMATIGTDDPDRLVPSPVRVGLAGRASADASMVLLTPRFDSSAHVVALIDDPGGEPLVAKTPRSPDPAEDQLDVEAHGLRSVTTLEPARPMIVDLAEHFGQRWLVQTRVVGTPLTRNDVAHDADRWIESGHRWLDRMPVGDATHPLEDGRIDRLVRPALDRLRALAAHRPGYGELVDDAERAISRVGSERLPCVCEHGDYRPPNLIVTAGGDLVAVDWELAEPDGFPLHDRHFFDAFVSDLAPSHRTALDEFEAAHLARLGVPAVLRDALVSICWLRHLVGADARTRGGAGGDRRIVPVSPIVEEAERHWREQLARRSVEVVG